MNFVEVGTDKLLHLSGGYAECVTDGKTVLKTISVGKNEETAIKKFQTLNKEYLLIKSYLKEFAVETQFNLLQNQDRFYIRVYQEFILGKPFRQRVDASNHTHVNFFINCLNLYHDKGFMPDMLPDIMPDPSGGVYITGKYNFRPGPNVLVLPDAKPILVDTTLNRSLRNPVTGPILSSIMAQRIKNIIGIM